MCLEQNTLISESSVSQNLCKKPSRCWTVIEKCVVLFYKRHLILGMRNYPMTLFAKALHKCENSHTAGPVC